MATKTCVKCGQTKPKTDFGKAPTCSDGLRGDCKACCSKKAAERLARDPEAKERAREAGRAWARRNPDKIAAKTAGYRAQNIERLRERDRAVKQAKRADPVEKAKLVEARKRWSESEAGRAYMKAYNEKYYEENKVAVKAQVRAYLDANPDKAKAWSQNYRARRRTGGKLTGADVRAVLNSEAACLYCDAPFSPDNPATLDHIRPLSQGGTNDAENLAPCCKSCNSRKKHRCLYEWEPPIGLSRVVEKIAARLVR